MAKKKYYAVVRGRKPGIYHEWFGPGGAEVQVKGFPKARFKGFPSMQEAKSWMAKPLSNTRPEIRSTQQSDSRRSSNPLPPQKVGAITIYTDGGCLNNPGPGGYGVVMFDGNQSKELSGGFRLTTNNRMELTACIVALKAIPENSSVVLYSDSKYVVHGITKGWAERWRANAWMRTKHDPAVNPDLWEELLELIESRHVQFKWVKGHVGIKENERCDALAKEAMSQKRLPKDKGYLGSPLD